MMMAVNKYSGLAYDEKPSLFLEFHGSSQHTTEQAEVVGMFFDWSVTLRRLVIGLFTGDAQTLLIKLCLCRR